MILGELTPGFVLISILLKLTFFTIIFVELMLPRIRAYELELSWETDWKREFQQWVVEGGAFLGSIVFLGALDVLSADDSWMPLYLSLIFDGILVIAIVGLLTSPKKYGIAAKGIYINGLTIPWSEIISLEMKGGMMMVKRRGFHRETKNIPLPVDSILADELLGIMLGRIDDLPKNDQLENGKNVNE